MGLSLPAPTLTMQLFNITITIGIVYDVAANGRHVRIARLVCTEFYVQGNYMLCPAYGLEGYPLFRGFKWY